MGQHGFFDVFTHFWYALLLKKWYTMFKKGQFSQFCLVIILTISLESEKKRKLRIGKLNIFQTSFFVSNL